MGQLDRRQTELVRWSNIGRTDLPQTACHGAWPAGVGGVCGRAEKRAITERCGVSAAIMLIWPRRRPVRAAAQTKSRMD
jgi:hypothetical protein